MRMQGKVGIVTASGSGMGRAGAVRFAREGAAMGVVDLDPAAAAATVKTITDAGGRAMAISAPDERPRPIAATVSGAGLSTAM
jgi:NAD(P)-dependent dehydrogenase (short-subunit alcohol dehydrogenase family)